MKKVSTRNDILARPRLNDAGEHIHQAVVYSFAKGNHPRADNGNWTHTR